MPEGTSFTTPSGTIRCSSSSRGITCTDLTNGASFTIGDYAVVLHQASPAGAAATPHEGYFASVDRRERCYLGHAWAGARLALVAVCKGSVWLSFATCCCW